LRGADPHAVSFPADIFLDAALGYSISRFGVLHVHWRANRTQRSNTMNPCSKLAIAPLLIALATVSTGLAQEKKIKAEDLPPAVQKTVAEQSKGATTRGFSTEIENGKRIYEVELMVDGHGKDISMDKEGNILEVEEEVSVDSLPAAVREGLKKAASAGTIDKVESITKKGKLVAYEAAVKTEGKRSEIQVGPDGKKLAHLE
jgi:uncharacterized membrane protein YkoI